MDGYKGIFLCPPFSVPVHPADYEELLYDSVAILRPWFYFTCLILNCLACLLLIAAMAGQTAFHTSQVATLAQAATIAQSPPSRMRRRASSFRFRLAAYTGSNSCCVNSHQEAPEALP